MPAVLAAILLAWAFLFFFMGIEVAFQSSNKLLIDLEEKQGFLRGKVLLFLVKQPAWFFCSTLVGKILALIFLCLHLIGWLALDPSDLPGEKMVYTILQTGGILLLIILTTYFLSHVLFALNPNRMLGILLYPFAIFFVVLLPITFTLIALGRIVMRKTQGTTFPDVAPLFTPSRYWSDHFSSGGNSLSNATPDLKQNNKILQNALEFKRVKVRDCMIPRTEIIGMDIQDGITRLQDIFIQSGHSKIIVYKENMDNIVGYCHSSALFRQPQTVEEILTPIITIPETALASDLMTRFIDERKNLAAVMDEFGGTAGLVSMEDVIEEIFGDIEDEYDTDELTELIVDENTFLFSGRLEIDYLNETYSLNLPVGDYDTLGGFILSLTEDLPKSGDTTTFSNYTFTIQSTLENRIGIVKLVHRPAQDAEEEKPSENP